MHVTHVCQATHINESRTHIWTIHEHKYKWVRNWSDSTEPHARIHSVGVATRTNGESCHTHEWVISHVWMSHTPEACHTCVSDHTYEWITNWSNSTEPHTRIQFAGVVTNDEFCHTHECLKHICDMPPFVTHLYVRHDSSTCVTWPELCHTHECLKHICDMPPFVTHLYVRHDSSTCVTWPELCHTCECAMPLVEWRGLTIGRNLIHTKVVYCIFRCQSIRVQISGDNLSSRIFCRNHKFQDKMT